MNKEMMRHHVETLAEVNNITIQYKAHCRGKAWKASKVIKIMEVKSPVTYAIALHELGHILGKQPKRRLDREVAAWDWAKENAIKWDDTMQHTAVSRLKWYEQKAQRVKHMVVATPTHKIFDWIGEE